MPHRKDLCQTNSCVIYCRGDNRDEHANDNVEGGMQEILQKIVLRI